MNDLYEEAAARGNRRRYVGDHKNAISYTEIRATNLLKNLRKAVSVLEEMIEVHGEEHGLYGRGVVPLSALKEMRTAYQLLDNTQRLLPEVECWTVGRPSFDKRTVIWGCQTKAQAERLCERANKIKAHNDDRWTIEYGPSLIHMIVKRSYTADDLEANNVR